ncbi:hypothetical protein [Geminocystis sp.]|uniref:hypothetical protein n=1 Tax=Geminocystis sp. TaxID=2664100 RepID=UPI003593E1FD
MYNNFFYLLRATHDGKYLAANIEDLDLGNQTFLLVFKEDYDALGYVNHHTPEYSHKFTVESVSSPQLKSLLPRWGFSGIAIVEDILIPKIKFSTVD